MTRSDTENFIRLGIGLALNLCLWPLGRELAKWGSYERETQLALISGSLAAVALVSVAPLFWRGRAWQTPIAFVLLWLPAFALYGIVSSVIPQL